MAPIERIDDVWKDGPPMRLRQLARVSGLSIDTLRRERDAGCLKTTRNPRHRTGNPEMVTRTEAQRWLIAMGLAPERFSSAQP